MYESPMSIYIKKYYLDTFGFALYLLYADRLMKELVDMGYPECLLIPIKKRTQKDYEYIKFVSQLGKKEGMF